MKQVLLLVSLLGLIASANATTTVFSTDFDAALPTEVSLGSATLTGVQGFAGLGPPGNPFAASFLRSPTGNTVTLSLSGLPAHTSLSIAFLFAAIDSLDGTGTFPAGDFLAVTLDGTLILRESFANALLSQVQSYVPPPGVELARRVDLGFQGPGGFFTDSAYDLGADPVLQNRSHTASTAVITFIVEGEGIQSLDDESWAMDNLSVSVTAVPIPAALPLMLGGLGVAGACARRRAR